ERKATAADDEGNDGVHLRVAERDRGPVTFETFDERTREGANATVVPARHCGIELFPARQRPGLRGIEEPVLVTGLHAPGVEAVSQALPQRQRVEADLRVEPCIRASPNLLRSRCSGRQELVTRDDTNVGRAARP